MGTDFASQGCQGFPHLSGGPSNIGIVGNALEHGIFARRHGEQLASEIGDSVECKLELWVSPLFKGGERPSYHLTQGTSPTLLKP